MDNQLSTPNLESEIATSDSLIVTPQSKKKKKKMAEMAPFEA